MKVCTEPKEETALMLFMANFFAKNISDESCRCPFLVLTSRLVIAKLLEAVLNNVEKRDRPAFRSRVLRIDSDSFQRNECREFLADPASNSWKWDVVITTPVMQSSISIDNYFKVVFDFMYPGILTHDEEMEFMNRVRPEKNGKGVRCRYSYIQKGPMEGSDFETETLLERVEKVDDVTIMQGLSSKDPIPAIEKMREWSKSRTAVGHYYFLKKITKKERQCARNSMF